MNKVGVWIPILIGALLIIISIRIPSNGVVATDNWIIFCTGNFHFKPVCDRRDDR